MQKDNLDSGNGVEKHSGNGVEKRRHGHTRRQPMNTIQCILKINKNSEAN